MMVVTTDQMYKAERQAMDAGISEAALLESAGRHVADIAADRVPRHGRVTILCGVGHNAGDGFVAARYLANRDLNVHLVLTRPIEQLSPTLQSLVAPLPSMGVKVVTLGDDESATERCRAILVESHLVIDALLGTGAKGEPRGAIRAAVNLVHALRSQVLAVDIPTGVDADSGKVSGASIRASATVVMSAPKPGHLLMPAAERCGDLLVVDVGIPRQLIEQVSQAKWVRPADVVPWFPARPIDSHKGTFGKILVIAGSRTMPGAAVLAVQAGLRSGAGLCSWAGPESLWSTIAAHAPEATVFSLPDRDGVLCSEAVAPALAAATDRCVALGPGMGLSHDAGAFVDEFLKAYPGPVVVDADGLTHLASLGSWPGEPRGSRVLTPHPKELARLLDVPLSGVLTDRMHAVRRAAKRYQAVVLLKGYPTLIANPEGQLFFCPVGNPVLAVGGSGDVLTGLIAGLLAQGMTPFEAAALGAVWHGTAGDLLAHHGENAAHTAVELVAKLAPARVQLLSQR